MFAKSKFCKICQIQESITNLQKNVVKFAKFEKMYQFYQNFMSFKKNLINFVKFGSEL